MLGPSRRCSKHRANDAAVIRRTQVINKPVEEVFDLLADPGSYAQLAVQHADAYR
jgi:uncharacterized protein YndB with AHSA1/START domain